MKKYKLKKEVRQFFTDSMTREVRELSWWEKNFVRIEILDEVSKVYVEYGQKKNESRTDLCGHSSPSNKAEFYFTLFVNDMDSDDYKSVSIPKVMDEIQKAVDKHFKYGMD